MEHFNVKECQPIHNKYLLILDTGGWLILAGLGVIGGIVGCALYSLLLSPFCK